ncbi:endonuclease VIII [Halomonas sp. PR-M31]|uniref:endonuclease VIII n=1 Tax=Halomonas sp. PR-M31 TaxID=1471202 RepID=UPI00065129A3|nr:endonuclease VIII [Halomonas sp. PR-M31]
MPEGPEIRRTADALQEQIGGRRLDEVWFAFPELASQAASLKGREVAAVDSWGKALLIRFDDERVLYSHNQLYGVWKYHDEEREPDTKRSLRARLTAQGRSASLYSASDISLWQADRLKEHPFLARLGPDLLTHAVSVGSIVERLEATRFKRRALGNLLLDQSLFAGIGNYLRSEILFFARLSYRQRPMDLTTAQREQLARMMLEVVERAYRQKGVTNRDDWAKAARRQGEKRQQWRFAVFQRDGLPCHGCGRLVERTMVASRRLYFCPVCQGN